ncbi:MAG TPA: hypothetical protein VKY85_20375 [Candidatus Angelobacter sp.]|nr:hypothetical protein [Candidatus Angelobacter sp.]
MRKTAMLVLVALLAVTATWAQQPADANSGQSATAPMQNGNNSTPNTADPDQNVIHRAVSPAATQAATRQDSGNSGFGQGAAVSSGAVPANTEMRAILDTPLSSKTCMPGDRFTATISQPVQGSNGVALPAGARVEGEVSESGQGKTMMALRGRGQLNLRLRDIVLPSGQTVPLMASLVSVNSTNGTQKADNKGQVESGTIGSPIFGGPLKGFAMGTLAGGGYVLAINGKDVNLPAQTGLVIRLEQTLAIQ